jgi:putative ABC transport system ATP-binding protein
MWRIPFMVSGSKNDKVDAAPTQALIDLTSVVKSYKTPAGEFQALKGIDLKIDAGEFVAVVGKSGSGKSTLSNMITGIDRPTAGEVIVAGTEVHKLRESQIAGWRGRNIGVVFQFFQLLPTLTVVENVMLPMDFCNMYSSRQRKERALHLLEQVDMVDQADKLPTAISGGQQQRVAIARSLANDPALIVADEPTGNLDSRTADAVFHLFERLVDEGKTIVMVTHDEDLARSVGRAVTIADGRIASDTRRTEYVHAQVHVPHTVTRPADHPHFVLPSPLGFGAAAAD